MSFTLINAWAVGDELTSAQQNAVAVTLTKCLDKTAAGDTLSGLISLAGGGAILLSGAGQLVVGAAGAMTTSVAGGFVLAGGATDYPTFSAARSRTIVQPAAPSYIDGTVWHGANSAPTGVQGTGTGASIAIPIYGLHNGSTLTQVAMQVIVVSHVGGTLTTTLPKLDVRRIQIGANASVSLLSGGPTSATAASDSAWYNSGNAQTWSCTPNQNNVIDTTQYLYYVVLTDENGYAGGSGDFYGPMSATYSAIADMRFP